MISAEFRKRLIWLILISAAIRAFLAGWLELGNDEVYYWTYALYPDWSHFDHPPMVGWVIQLFSLNLLLDHALFLRLSSIVFMALNTWIIFQAGKLIRDERTGFYAALLYNTSVYAFVITGVFILPDTPQNLFWMLSLLLMLRLFRMEGNSQKSNKQMLLLGLTIGLAVLSKYTGVFLWLGAGLYILLFERSWLFRPAFYGALLITTVCSLPIIIWNMQHDWISFTFQGARVSFFEGGLRPDFFFQELFGQMGYNNPVNYVLTLLAVIAALRGNLRLHAAHRRLLLLIALPLIGVFLFFALFRATLPHWTGPAFNTLLLLAALRLAEIKPVGKVFPGSIRVAAGLLVFILLLGSLQIKHGLIPIKDENPYHRLGRHDVTLDLYGWQALKPEFEKVRQKHIAANVMQEGSPLVAENWFPLANLDYYVARPLNITMLGLGHPHRLHKYNWINEERGGFVPGENYWYLTDSRNYKHPESLYAGLFDEIVAADTITIMRAGKPAKRVFVFLLIDLQQMPESYFN